MESLEQPLIVKITENCDSQIRDLHLKRMAVGMVLRGEMRLYYNDHCTAVSSGKIFLLGEGVHYVDSRCENGLFEQIVFYISATVLQDAIVTLSAICDVKSRNNHSCEQCAHHNFFVADASGVLIDFFNSVNQNFRRNSIIQSEAYQRMRISELIYHILVGNSDCLKARLLSGADHYKSDFARTVYDNIFTTASIEQLAQQTNRSLTSFKKEFSNQFNSSPHQWLVAQRLHHAKILLTTSQMTISEVGTRCAFTNISHFIKLFKRRYGTTPSAFRKDLLAGGSV